MKPLNPIIQLALSTQLAVASKKLERGIAAEEHLPNLPIALLFGCTFYTGYHTDDTIGSLDASLLSFTWPKEQRPDGAYEPEDVDCYHVSMPDFFLMIERSGRKEILLDNSKIDFQELLGWFGEEVKALG